MKKQKREFKFYTPEEEKELRKVLAEGKNITQYANEYAEYYGRTPASIVTKFNSLKKTQTGKFTQQQETILKHCVFRGDEKNRVIDKYSKEWNMSKMALSVKLSWLMGNITKSVADETHQGVLFEGTPTKVVLFSDHFRVYF